LLLLSNIGSIKHRKIGCCKIFRQCSLENENGIMGFVFSEFLKKKRTYKKRNDEIGEISVSGHNKR